MQAAQRAQATAAPAPVPRRMGFPFDGSIPRHWFGGNPIPTHVVNGVNLLFPAGERFFVRSVRHYLDRFEDDPAMTARIRGFFGQEGSHAREHERFFRILEEQGYEIRPFLDAYEGFAYGTLEKVIPPALRLAGTAAAEHFTAIMAEAALTDGFLDELAHPVMRDLLLWHAAEEIEHKDVAFDVLERVAPGYAVRVVGMALAAAMLFTWWTAATRMLFRQDGLDREGLRQARRRLPPRDRTIAKDVLLAGIREYLRPGFHPNDRDNRHLAIEYLERIGRADG